MSAEIAHATKAKSDVMLAFSSGSEIESKPQRVDQDWRPDPCPDWDWLSFEYRVKPKRRRCELYPQVAVEFEHGLSISLADEFTVVDRSGGCISLPRECGLRFVREFTDAVMELACRSDIASKTTWTDGHSDRESVPVTFPTGPINAVA